jgi:hypothetical protein
MSRNRQGGCRCRKRGRGCSPKVATSLCHRVSGDYHPAVMERIKGKRIVAEALLEIEKGQR